MSAKLRVAARILGLVCCLGMCPDDTLATNSPVIYRCQMDGVPTFSDHPCGQTAEVHESSAFAMNTYEAPRIESKPPSRERARPKPRAPTRAAADPKSAAAACDRLERSLAEIRSKMRAGYSAAEGERLKARQAKLRGQRQRARCS